MWKEESGIQDAKALIPRGASLLISLFNDQGPEQGRARRRSGVSQGEMANYVILVQERHSVGGEPILDGLF